MDTSGFFYFEPAESLPAVASMWVVEPQNRSGQLQGRSRAKEIAAKWSDFRNFASLQVNWSGVALILRHPEASRFGLCRQVRLFPARSSSGDG